MAAATQRKTTQSDPQVEAETTPPTKVKLIAKHKLREPYLNIWFNPGTPVEVDKKTSWMQSQIDAGLMEEVK